MAEDKYGWAALHPALAKVQENLASMSGDEMAVDGSDSESNPEDRMVVDSGPEKPAAPAKKKRKVQDLYDASDPFIDDSEQMWEEQAAATKDGFFVYSGPLVREGETAQIERYVLTLFSEFLGLILTTTVPMEPSRDPVVDVEEVEAVVELEAAAHQPSLVSLERRRPRRSSRRKKRRQPRQHKCHGRFAFMYLGTALS